MMSHFGPEREGRERFPTLALVAVATLSATFHFLPVDYSL